MSPKSFRRAMLLENPYAKYVVFTRVINAKNVRDFHHIIDSFEITQSGF